MLEDLFGPRYRFSPLHISGCQLWLAADRITGLADADPVTTWADLSGNGRDATQATVAKKPTYKVNIVNGRPVVRFDGVDDVLKVILTVAQPFTLVLVTKPTTSANSRTLMGGEPPASSIYKSATDKGGYFSGSVASSTTGIAGAFHIIAGIFNGASSSLTVDSTTTDAGNPGTNGLTDSWVGAGDNGSGLATEWVTGDIAEVVVYNLALGAGKLGRLTRYLGHKYGIGVN